jgi:hypothetical protein
MSPGDGDVWSWGSRIPPLCPRMRGRARSGAAVPAFEVEFALQGGRSTVRHERSDGLMVARAGIRVAFPWGASSDQATTRASGGGGASALEIPEAAVPVLPS